MAAQAKDDWQKAMNELAHEEPELLQHFQKLSEAAGKVGKACSYKPQPHSDLERKVYNNKWSYFIQFIQT